MKKNNMKEMINVAYEEGKEEGAVTLTNKKIDDAAFIYLLTKETQTVIKLFLGANKLSRISMSKMRDVNWYSLAILQLRQNRIGRKGCKYLSRVIMPQLRWINLSSNIIGSLGVSHLSKAQWKLIQEISLDSNQIGVEGVQGISKANWHRTMAIINLWDNKLGVSQVQKLVLCDMPKISNIFVKNNRVEEWSEHKLVSTLKLKFVEEDNQVWV